MGELSHSTPASISLLYASSSKTASESKICFGSSSFNGGVNGFQLYISVTVLAFSSNTRLIDTADVSSRKSELRRQAPHAVMVALFGFLQLQNPFLFIKQNTSFTNGRFQTVVLQRETGARKWLICEGLALADFRFRLEKDSGVR
jgi:hypothetical protein